MHGIAAGSYNTVFITADEGVTWKFLPTGCTVSMNAVSRLDSTSFFVAGERGHLLKFTLKTPTRAAHDGNNGKWYLTPKKEQTITMFFNRESVRFTNTIEIRIFSLDGRQMCCDCIFDPMKIS